MEKKNVVFLTVLSIATLLTAVIGTTFAYFTASINTSGVQSTGTVTTAILPGLTVASGTIQGPTTIYPGWGGYQVVTANGSSPSGSTATASGSYTLKFTDVTNNIGNDLVADVYTATGSGVTVTTANYDASACVPTSNASGHYSMTGCTFTPGATFGTAIATGVAVANDTVLDNNTFDKDTNRTYVIVYRFVNNTSAAQENQGTTFTASVTAVARASA